MYMTVIATVSGIDVYFTICVLCMKTRLYMSIVVINPHAPWLMTSVIMLAWLCDSCAASPSLVSFVNLSFLAFILFFLLVIVRFILDFTIQHQLLCPIVELSVVNEDVTINVPIFAIFSHRCDGVLPARGTTNFLVLMYASIAVQDFGVFLHNDLLEITSDAIALDVYFKPSA